MRRTPRGEIAWQLGGAKSFAVVEQHEREFIEPKGDAIRALLPKDRPVLILMDEIISYVSTASPSRCGFRQGAKCKCRVLVCGDPHPVTSGGEVIHKRASAW